MYLPDYFNESDPTVIFDFISSNSFATLISSADGVPYASHLPLLVEMQHDQLILRGHFAKANKHWQLLQQKPQLLIIFQGPHCYVSPDYYQQAGVPTWNYVTVHAEGQATLTHHSDDIKSIIEQLAMQHESHRDTSWMPDYPDKMVQAIVGFSIRVDRLEAKYKLSQNRPAADRDGVIQNLSRLNDPQAQAIAALMKQRQ